MVRTYNPKAITQSMGHHTVQNVAEDTFVSIEAHGDGVTKVVGADGEVGRSIDPDKTYTVTITVMQTSPTLDWAQNMYDRDQATGDGLFPYLMKNLKGGEIFSAADCWIESVPSREYAKTKSEVEIIIATGEGGYS